MDHDPTKKEGLVGCVLNNADFLVSQAVDLVDQLVDLLVGRVNLALDELLFHTTSL